MGCAASSLPPCELQLQTTGAANHGLPAAGPAPQRPPAPAADAGGGEDADASGKESTESTAVAAGKKQHDAAAVTITRLREERVSGDRLPEGQTSAGEGAEVKEQAAAAGAAREEAAADAAGAGASGQAADAHASRQAAEDSTASTAHQDPAGASPPSWPPLDVTLRGVTLSYLLQLAQGGELESSWTIHEVVKQYVRPRTSGSQGCLFDVVPREYTGPPRFFISHTWTGRYGDLMDLLMAHFQEPGRDLYPAGQQPEEHGGSEEDGPGPSLRPPEATVLPLEPPPVPHVLLWLDIVAINQHPYEQESGLLQEDVSNLAKVVRATQHTLFCLDAQCTSLSRIWCLYEAQATMDDDRVKILGAMMASNVHPEEINMQLKRAIAVAADATRRDAAAGSPEQGDDDSDSSVLRFLNLTPRGEFMLLVQNTRGLGKGVATRIMDARQTHGQFLSWNAFKERVSGLGPTKLRALRECCYQ